MYPDASMHGVRQSVRQRPRHPGSRGQPCHRDQENRRDVASKHRRAASAAQHDRCPGLLHRWSGWPSLERLAVDGAAGTSGMPSAQPQRAAADRTPLVRSAPAGERGSRGPACMPAAAGLSFAIAIARALAASSKLANHEAAGNAPKSSQRLSEAVCLDTGRWAKFSKAVIPTSAPTQATKHALNPSAVAFMSTAHSEPTSKPIPSHVPSPTPGSLPLQGHDQLRLVLLLAHDRGGRRAAAAGARPAGVHHNLHRQGQAEHKGQASASGRSRCAAHAPPPSPQQGRMQGRMQAEFRPACRRGPGPGQSRPWRWRAGRRSWTWSWRRWRWPSRRRWWRRWRTCLQRGSLQRWRSRGCERRHHQAWPVWPVYVASVAGVSTLAPGNKPGAWRRRRTCCVLCAALAHAVDGAPEAQAAGPARAVARQVLLRDLPAGGAAGSSQGGGGAGAVSRGGCEGVPHCGGG
jgi:hypothetical protein